MKRTFWDGMVLLAALIACALGLMGSARACDLIVSWVPPTTCTDGSAVSTCGPITGYSIWTAQNTGSAQPTSPLSGSPAVTVGAGVLTYDFADTPCGSKWSITLATNETIQGIASISPQTTIATGTATGSVGANPPTGVVIASPSTVLHTAGGTVYDYIKSNGNVVLLPVGTIPAGIQCDNTQGVFAKSTVYYLVPLASVSLTATIKPPIPLSLCQ